jgi:hypothetical protein
MNPRLQHPQESLGPDEAQQLDAQLDALRRETATLSAPAELQAKLVAAFSRHHAAQANVRHWREVAGQWFAPGFALAASIGMAAWMLLLPAAQFGMPGGGTMARADEPPFIALQSLEQIALEPKPRLIETTVPRMWLASYGVAVSPEVAGETMRAEMLVSANGQPLAMRFLP